MSGRVHTCRMWRGCHFAESNPVHNLSGYILHPLGYAKAAIFINQLWHLIIDAGSEKTYSISHCEVCVAGHDI